MEATNFEIRDLLPTKHDIDFLTTMVYIAHYPTRSPIPNATIASHIPQVFLWVDQWGKKGDVALIARQGDQFLGAACYRLFSVRDQVTGFLSEQVPVLVLAVLPQYRRQGVGCRLLTTLMQRAKDASFPALSLTVSMRNPAISLYEQAGFHSVKVNEELLVTMRKPLAFSDNTRSLPASITTRHLHQAC
jgi:GNAT superfamily N-acetyltransferase